MTPGRRLALIGLLGCAAACTTGEVPQGEPVIVERSAVERGAAAFQSAKTSRHPFNSYACSTCHPSGEADPARSLPGASLAGVVERPSFWAGEEIDLLRAVNQCLLNFMLDDEAWTGTEPIAVDMYAYLESLSSVATAEPAPFTVVYEVADLPGGDPVLGQDVFARACAVCHGAPHTGEGRLVEFSAVLPEDLLASHPLGEYTAEERRRAAAEKVRHGPFLGYGGIMPPFSREVLSDDEVAGLLAFFGL